MTIGGFFIGGPASCNLKHALRCRCREATGAGISKDSILKIGVLCEDCTRCSKMDMRVIST